MKWYEVHNYANGNEYVNEDSDITDIERIWTTNIPWNFKPHEDYEPTKPYQFMSRSDALRIKDALQSVRLDDWARNKMTYILRSPERKPAWKIYKFESP